MGAVQSALSISHTLPGLDLYHADLAQTLTAAGLELDDLDHDLSDLLEVCSTAVSLSSYAVRAPVRTKVASCERLQL